MTGQLVATSHGLVAAVEVDSKPVSIGSVESNGLPWHQRCSSAGMTRLRAAASGPVINWKRNRFR